MNNFFDIIKDTHLESLCHENLKNTLLKIFILNLIDELNDKLILQSVLIIMSKFYKKPITGLVKK